ncbi:hypothetical protein PILCRDRAFT_389561 [Piloderma croceum F 1598]|uniref:MIT domain-containing protein n=1 Tax=Piloderma croceum (strain F 1598) TaxID=765440 RepID=A0A0C3C4R7_PILCF|nr:hypothetical protein PILCRDRAFT_389561 [Piloderma croceum F 1598]
MEVELESRPVSVGHRARDWPDPSQAGVGPSSSVGPPSAFSQPLTNRRRSSAANVPPAGPPPSQPIPSLPPASTSPSSRGSWELDDDAYSPQLPLNGLRNGYSQFMRPVASANLTAVAAFSQRNAIPVLNNTQPSAASSSDNLSDPPPRSMLPASSRALTQHQEIVPDRLLLSPPESRTPAEAKPSSRRALTKALELAREAVKLDSTNDDPYAAVMAYGRSVALLSEVMERVRRGEDSTEIRKKTNGRRRSVVAQEEEVRRLKSIHDTYADRMNILSLIYSIPPIPHSPTAVYASSMSTSTDSTRPSSPSSNSPSSDSSDPVPRTPSAFLTDHNHDVTRQFIDRDVDEDSSDDADGTEAIGSAMFISGSPGAMGLAKADLATAYHPYAAVAPEHDILPQDTSTSGRITTQPPTRSSQIIGRPRASSALPPPPPPPSNALPPAPDNAISDFPVESSSARAKYLEIGPSNVAGHKRTGSGSRLTALREEVERYDDRPLQNQQRHHFDTEDELRAGFKRPSTPHTTKRDSHPLPPLPSANSVNSDSSSVRTAHNHTIEQPPKSPLSPQYVTPRPRGESSLSAWSDARISTALMQARRSQDNLINATPMDSAIHQRRTKVSAPPTVSSSPVDATMSLPSTTKLSAASLPLTNPTPLGMGRSRSSSQPGRRPSLVGGRVSPFDQRPPLPQTAGLNGATSRKLSYSSKLNPMVQPPQLVIQTELVPPPAASTLLVPPPVFAPNIPTTPTSPLPPAPPLDALRKPYHMMSLLRNTMTSKTGGYVTRRLHVPHEVWSQGGAKLNNVLEKVRVVEVLCSALEDLQNSSAEYFGSGNGGSGLGSENLGRKEGEGWIAKLEEFSSVCDGVVANFGKKLGVGEGFALKKTTGVTAWGGILARQFDKVTKGKNLDSPAAYVMGLTRLFSMAQLLDDHTKALCLQPVAPVYNTLPTDIRTSVEMKLRRSSEFFATVVLTFVIRDLSQLLDKYAKKCEKWLAE